MIINGLKLCLQRVSCEFKMRLIPIGSSINKKSKSSIMRINFYENKVLSIRAK